MACEPHVLELRNAGGAGEPPVLELRDVGLRFSAVKVLAGVNLSCARGERVALIGPSGAGKTSLLSLLNGILAPTDGGVCVLGHDLATASPRELRAVRRQIGTVHQTLDLVGQLRVVHNVNAGRLGRWPLWRAALSLMFPSSNGDSADALGRLGISDKLHERTDHLSGGEQQRVAIARVLVQKPAIVLADEPISSVDPARQREIIELLLESSARTGTTLLFSLHDVAVALGSFPRVVGLRDGQVAFDLPAEEVSGEMIEDLYRIERSSGR